MYIIYFNTFLTFTDMLCFVVDLPTITFNLERIRIILGAFKSCQLSHLLKTGHFMNFINCYSMSHQNMFMVQKVLFLPS